MNGILNINVRVAAQQAQAGLRTIQQQVNALNNTAKRGGMGAMFGTAQMEKFGKNLQWTGRQLEFNFTLPILAAGYAASKWALDNERAMVQVQKVYGNGTESAGQLRAELDALGTSFELLSSRFGVHQDEVIEIAGAWAQAGAAGRGLAESTRLTLETMILGQMDAQRAAEGLIGIQSAYALSTKELTAVVADLNIIENQTGITLQGLVEVLARAGGTARTAGIEIKELAALAAALVPAAGSASQAGNALRTIISRIMAPTKEASDLMGLMGINIREAGWQSQDAMGRIEILADAFMGLSDSQKTVVSSAVASRWQLNRFDLMMEQVAGNSGFFQRALDATNEELRKTSGITTTVADVMRNELLTALQSQPQQLKILWNVLRNTLSTAIQPMIPHIIMLAQGLVGMAQAFAGLSPEVQQLIVLGLLLLAVIGPIARYMGAFTLLFSTAAKAIGWVATMLVGQTGAQAAANTATAASIPITTAATTAHVAQIGVLGVLRLRFLAIAAAVGDVLITALWRAAGILDTFVALWGRAWAGLVSVVRVAGAGIATASAAVWQGMVTGAAVAGRAMVAVSSATGTAMVAIWRATAAVLAFVFTTLPASIAAAGRATLLAWTQVTALFGFLSNIGWGNVWLAVQTRMVVATGAATTAIQGLWFRAQMAMMTASTGFVARIGALWFTFTTYLATLSFKLEAAMSSAYIRTQVVAMGAASRIAAAFSGAYAAMTRGLVYFSMNWQSILRTIPVLFAIVVQKMSMMWLALQVRMLVMWSTFQAAFSMGLRKMVAKFFISTMMMLSGITAPMWGAIALIAAVVVAALALIENLYEGGIGGLVRDIGNALGQLPSIVASVFRTVVRVVAAAMEQVADWLSYLNPFSRHSPSLVENVENGVGVILDQYARLRNIPSVLAGAIRALRSFNEAAAGGKRRMEDAEYAEQRAAISAVAPEAVPAADELYASLQVLRPMLEDIGREVADQELVVQKWAVQLDLANKMLDAQEMQLDELKRVANAARAALDLAVEELEGLQAIKPTGWYAMEQAIFDNEAAQKRLRLEMLRLEEAGQSVEDLESKLASLRGEIEMLRGDRESLRLAGAGSDVLGAYDDQIRQLEQMEDATIAAGSPINELQKELEKLQRTGEILDLESWLEFEPMQRQIDMVGKSMAEMPFDQLLDEIKTQQTEVDRLRESWNRAEDAVQMQETSVALLVKQRDEMKASYDTEKSTLDQLSEAYRTVEQTIRDMESALNDFAASAERSLADAKSQAEELFAAGEGFDFEDIGGVTGIGREGELIDIEAFNKDMEKQLQDALAGMGANIDPFEPIKQKFKDAWEWVKNNAVRLALGALAGLAAGLAIGAGGWALAIVVAIGAGLNALLGGRLWEAMQAAWTWVTDQLWPWLVELFGPTVEVIGDVLSGIGDALGAVWTGVLQPLLKVMSQVFGAIFGAIGAIIKTTWEQIIRPVLDFLVSNFRTYVIPVLQLVGAIAEIVFVTIGRILMWVWTEIISPVFGFIVGVIGTVLVPAFQLFAALVQIAISGVAWVIGWLWTEIISPVFQQIGNFIYAVWANIISPVFDAIAWVVRNVVAPVFGWLLDNVISPVFGAIGRVIGGVWDGVVTGFRNAMNFVIRAFNTLVNGVKRLAGFLNIDVTVSTIPEIGAAVTGGGGGGGGYRVMHSGGWVEGPFGGPGLRPDETRAVLQRGEFVLNRQDAAATARSAGGGTMVLPSRTESRTNVNIYGNLEFPNITSADDAEAFVQNLARLADG